MYYSERRLTHPLKRVGKRGEGKFEKISWSQALDELAEKLKKVKGEYGGESLGIFTGTRTGILTLSGFAPLFAGLFGTPNQAGTGPMCATASGLASQIIQGAGGGGHTYTEDDLGSADLYLFVGYNPAETRPVYFGALNDWKLKHGAKMVVIDPRQTPTASKADQWLPIRAGADMALALAMMHYVITHDLVDKAFVGKWVEGYDKIKEFILEKKYTPEWAAPITDIPKETIEQLAQEYGSVEKAIIFTQRGIDQHSNGLQTNRVWGMLAAMTGHWGKKGAGCGSSSLAGGSARGEMKVPNDRKAEIKRRGIRRTPPGWIEAMKTGKPYPMKALIMTCSALVLWPGQAKLREALQELDVIAHIGIWPDESAAYADYVFPVAVGIEAGEVTRLGEERRVAWIPKLIDPPGEAKQDGYFWVELGKRLGFDDVLKEEYKDPEVFWDAMNGQGFNKGMTVKRLRASPRGWLRGPLPEEDSEEMDTIGLEGTVYPGDPQGRRFLTPSGKLEIWTEEMEKKFNQVGLSALPEFYSEPEQLIDLPYLEYESTDAEEGVPSPFVADPVNTSRVRIVNKPREERKEYDTELVTARPPAAHFHAWTHWLWQPQQMWPDLFAQIHPEKAAKIGVKDGDRVVIESPRGRIEAVAWVFPGIRKTTIYVPMGWGEKQPYNPWYGVNWLMPKDNRCPISDQVNFKAT
ncbi:MAG: molybdopterin-dependent oxidoreductase, partial [Dehalococcoidales bacterium]|nr:molybdopterin-dependent oxidoreductase [Dehalococcoidales bacterium]